MLTTSEGHRSISRVICLHSVWQCDTGIMIGIVSVCCRGTTSLLTTSIFTYCNTLLQLNLGSHFTLNHTFIKQWATSHWTASHISLYVYFSVSLNWNLQCLAFLYIYFLFPFFPFNTKHVIKNKLMWCQLTQKVYIKTHWLDQKSKQRLFCT